MENLILHAFKGDWGIASIDLDCLIQLAYSKFANAPVEFDFKTRAYLSRLPFASLPTSKLRTYDEFTTYLRKHVSTQDLGPISNCTDNTLFLQKFDPNSHLNEDQKSLSLSYQHQLRTSLFPYYILTLVGKEENFTILRKLYGQRIRFPFSLLYPGKMERQAAKFKEAVYGQVPQEKDDPDAHQKATIEARIFLNSISKKLGDQKFFFGNKPCEFDAHLYAYLAILYHIQLPDHPIQSHIAQCPNLVAYVKRITKEYFVEEAHDSKTVYEFSSYVKGSGSDTTDSSREKKKERRFQILAGMFGVVLMGAYVVTSGLFDRDSFSQRRLEDFGYDDDVGDDDDDGDE